MALVPLPLHSSADPTCAFKGMPGRLPEQTPFGQGGLHTSSRSVSQSSSGIPFLGATRVGHFCIPWKSQTRQVYLSLAPLAGRTNRCTKLPPYQGQPLLCKPPLDINWKMAAKIVGKPPHYMSYGDPLLGFSRMVAPVTQTQNSKKPSGANSTIYRLVSKLPGGPNAPHQVAPDLHSFIRSIMEKQQISAESIQKYLATLPNPQRYQNAFQMLWTQCTLKKVCLSTATLWDIAGQILQLHSISAH